MKQVSNLQSFGERHSLHMRWARNSICWALAIKAEMEGRPLEAIEDAEAAHAQAFEIASQLWIEAMEDLGPDLTPSSADCAFTRKVTDWCASETGYAPAM